MKWKIEIINACMFNVFLSHLICYSKFLHKFCKLLLRRILCKVHFIWKIFLNLTCSLVLHKFDLECFVNQAPNYHPAIQHKDKKHRMTSALDVLWSIMLCISEVLCITSCNYPSSRWRFKALCADLSRFALGRRFFEFSQRLRASAWILSALARFCQEYRASCWNSSRRFTRLCLEYCASCWNSLGACAPR